MVRYTEVLMAVRLPLVLCLLFVAVPAARAQGPSAPSLQDAAEEFKNLSRNMGLRADSPRRARTTGRNRPVYRGRVTYNLRNDFLDATPHDVRQRGGDKNILRRNQFGFNVSGPVFVPKLYDGSRTTFISVSYEGVREKIGRSYLQTIPIPEQKAGDYRRVVDPAGNQLRIFDPQTTAANPDFAPDRAVSEDNLQYNRAPFPNMIIPANRLDPVALRSFSLYPNPNSDAGPFFRNNYFVFSPEVNTADGMILKLDHTFLEKHRLTVNYSFTDGLANNARFFDNPANPGPPDRTYSNRRASVQNVFTLSPQSVNTAGFEVVTDISDNSVELGQSPANIGLSGLAGEAFPYFSLTGGYLNMGRPNPVSRHARTTYILSDGHSLRMGKHNLRLSASLVRYQVNTSLATYPSGYFRFGAGLTSLPGIVNTGDSIASFLLGLPEYTEVSLVPSPSYFRKWRGTVAAQDTWELRPGLNMSFGLNVEISAPRTERYNRYSTVDLSSPNAESPRAGALVFAGRNGEGSAFQPTRVRPQPNWSLAWNPRGNRKAVARLSYGMSFSSFPMPNGQWATQGFNGYATYFSPNVQLEAPLVLRNGVPPAPNPPPDLRPEAANLTTADLVERSGQLPRYQSAGASYEREVRGSLVLTGGLGLAWGNGLFLGGTSVNPNAIHPDFLFYRDLLNDELFRRTIRPYPQYLGFNLNGAWPDGRYRREAAWLRVEKRMAQGLSLNAYYELSRQFDDYSGPGGRQDYFNRGNEWGFTSYNNPQRLSLNYMYELPIGTNKPFLAFEDWRRVLVNGWSLSGISSVTSGEPLALRAQFNNTGTVITGLRVDVVPGVDPHGPSQGPELWFNPAAFSHPDDFTMGNGPRTHPTLRGPTTQSHDLSVSKTFPIDQGRTLEFNASGFNFVNLGNWNDPDTVIGTAAAPNVNAGRIIGSRGGRVIQLGLRLSF
jgi:hypothetical protein